jgi:hypothetical protein
MGQLTATPSGCPGYFKRRAPAFIPAGRGVLIRKIVIGTSGPALARFRRTG